MNSRTRNILGLLFFVAVCFGAAWFGSRFTTPAIRSGWYEALQKPAWNPPRWLFGPVWSFLYLTMAVAAWLVWRKRGLRGARLPLALFFLQLVLNALWSLLFFGLRLPGLALLDLVALWGAILATLLLFWGIVPLAGWLLVPYLLWVTFAGALNFAIWRMNS